MANSASPPESTLQNNGGSPQDNASSAESKSLRNSNIPPGVDLPPNAGGASADEKVQDKQVGFFLLTLLIVVILLLSQSEPWGTWIAVIVGVIALALIVQILGRRLSAQRFWGLLVISAALVYAASLAYQAGAPARALRQQNSTAIPIIVNSTPVALVISYPGQAPLEKVDQPGLPLFVYIQAAMATPTSTPTSAPMPTLTATAASAAPTSIVATGVLTNAPTSTSTATSTATPTPTPTATATATPAAVILATGNISFTLAFLPQSEGLVFSDQTGGPVVPQIVVEGSDGGTQNAALYVRRSSANTDASRVNVNMALRTNGQTAYGQPLGVIDISPESTYAAWWRNFWGLLLGPATPILALVATLLGFGWQWWQSERERRAKQAATAAQFCQLAAVDPDAAALQYREVSAKAESEEWPADLCTDLQVCLTKLAERREQILLHCLCIIGEGRFQDCENLIWVVDETDKLTRRTSQGSLRLAVEIGLTYAQNNDKLWDSVKDRVGNVCEALFDSCREYADRSLSLLVGPLADLAGRPESIFEFAKQIQKHEPTRRRLLIKKEITDSLKRLRDSDDAPEKAREAAKELLQLSDTPNPWLRRHLWLRDRPEESDQINKWLDKMQQLAFNPFGPEAAERDAHLPDYVVDSVFVDTRGRRSVLVLAAPGAGRTAAALSIAHDCDYPLRDPRESASFPIYYTPPIFIRASNSANDHVQAIGVAASRWLIKLIASKPHVFLDTMSRSKQMGLVHLLKASLGSMDEVGYALHRSGESDVGKVLREMQAIDAGNARIRRISQDELSEVLIGALPDSYECVYLLADVQTPPSTKPQSGIADALAPLLEMATPMAAKDVFLKVFAPTTTLSPVAAPTGCTRITLSWTEGSLKSMLKQRVKNKDNQPVDFKELFDLSITKGDPTDLLVKASLTHEDAPRHLIRLGNTLLRKHVEQGRSDQVVLPTLQEVIKELQ